MKTQEKNETAVIACEVKISVTGNSYEEIKQLIERLREACEGNYKLEVNFCGEFFNVAPRKEHCATEQSEIERLIQEKLDERDKKFVENLGIDSSTCIKLFQELREVIGGSEPTQR